MKKVLSILAICFMFALSFPATAPAPHCATDCNDGIACTGDACVSGTCVYTPDDALCDDEIACTDDTCVEGEGCANTPVDASCDDGDTCTDNYCDPEDVNSDPAGCVFVDNNTCDVTCDPRTQGFWQRICKGEHPETPDNFDDGNCEHLLIKGSARSNPCVRARSQEAALLYNLTHNYLSEGCEVNLAGYDNVGDVVEEVASMIAAEDCKAAADLAEAVNSGNALQTSEYIN